MTITLEAGRRLALKNILFGTDFSSCSDAAFSYARSIARRYGATLNVAHVLPTMATMLVLSPDFGMDAAVHEDLRVQAYVQQLESQLETIPHHVLTPKGNVADELARIIEDHKIDLLVLGTHGRTGIRKLIMGSIAEETFRRAGCPVLSVGPNVSCEPNLEAKFHHILFATNFSRESLAALPYAISFAEENQAGLTLLHFVEQPAGGAHAMTKKSLLGRLEELIPADPDRRCHPECRVEFGELFISPAQGILDVAERREADLIVLGVRAVRGSLGLTTHLSTTTAQVLTQARCPVLTVRG
ncbi:MAG TPA: universal stress protein [Terriglobales bacterium]|nr:universal stress protein [Terriglobales bacterium]